jgi:hypothetical protein
MADFNPLMAGKQQSNPLQKYFRQPKVYITLPSKGKFYKPGAVDLPENGELPVFPMTAKDELTLKTPDALLNGQATVDVIQSCIPAIKDAWQMPSIDLDAALIGIRIATYGDKLDLTTKIPGLNEEREFSVDCKTLLNKLVTKEFVDTIEYNNMVVKIRPLNYREFTTNSIKTFEEQRIFALVNDGKMSEEEKLSKFNESFKKLTELTVDTMGKTIVSITVDDVIVTDRNHIQEFLTNTDKNFYSAILEHIEQQKELFSIEPLKVECSDEDVERGAPERFEVPITFDQSNFFG